jgi:hypothetical protein
MLRKVFTEFMLFDFWRLVLLDLEGGKRDERRWQHSSMNFFLTIFAPVIIANSLHFGRYRDRTIRTRSTRTSREEVPSEVTESCDSEGIGHP